MDVPLPVSLSSNHYFPRRQKIGVFMGLQGVGGA